MYTCFTNEKNAEMI